MAADTNTSFSAGRCDACGTEQGSLMKYSMGKDFFGRVYDRLSPSHDQSPKWYCERCSSHKTLQREFRDIRAEFDKLGSGQTSQLSGPDEFQRAQLRLREITELLSTQKDGSQLIAPGDVDTLLHRMESRPASPSAAG